MKRKILTLCIPRESDRILLGLKKRGFGAGKWNGFGGKLMTGENIEETARREVLEEVGISVLEMTRIGIVDFVYQHKNTIMKTYLYAIGRFEGEPKETEEMRPQWFDINKIPFDQMWPDDKYWMPLFLAGKSFEGEFHFDKNYQILSHEIEGEKIT